MEPAATSNATMEDMVRLYGPGCERALREVREYYEVGNLSRQTITEYKEHMFSPSFPAETAKYACEEWEPRENGVIIASYAKCGTHWLSEIVRTILYGRDQELDQLTKHISSPVMSLEMSPKSKYHLLENLTLPRGFFMTILSPTILPMQKFKDKNMKILYIMRNPKDRLLSWFNFAPNLPYTKAESLKHLYNKDWEIFFDDYMAGRQTTSVKKGQTYEDHILTWLPYQNEDYVKFLHFEDLKMDPVGKIQEISEFISCPLTKNEANEVADRTAIEKAQENVKSVKTESDQFKKYYGVIKRGKVGDWKLSPLMTEEKLRQIDAMVEEKLAGTGIKFIYELPDNIS